MKLSTIIVVLLVLCSLSLYTIATPEGAQSIERSTSERKTINATGNAQQAEAGNLTALLISSQAVTKRWQGFFGNISGGILIANGENNELFSWGLTNPSGEIYASNGSGVTWGNINCINFSTNLSEGKALKYNLSYLNEFIGLSTDSEQAEDDSVNATFNRTFSNSFEVGSITINSDDVCPMVILYDNNGYQETNFKEVMMTDNESIIFASILENNQLGFTGSPLDFEMLVGVNGTVVGTTREYYFYAEIS